MVVLYGVIHGSDTIGLFGERDPLVVEPSQDMLRSLAGFPSGSRIGIEHLSRLDFERLNRDLKRLCDEQSYMGQVPHYFEFPYWKILVSHCGSLGHEVVPIDDTDCFLRYNVEQVRLLCNSQDFLSLQASRES